METTRTHYLPLLLASTLVLVSMTTTVVSASEKCTKLETFNLGLIASVPGANVRRPEIIKALKASTSDFVCLQEVWMERDMAAIIDGVKSTFPHHYSAIHYKKDIVRKPRPWYWPDQFFKDTACNVAESVSLFSGVLLCMTWNGCFGKSGFELGICLTTNCESVLKRKHIRPSCVSCVFLNAFISINEAIGQCSTVSFSEHNRLNGPGLVILSKDKLEDVGYTQFYPNNRPTFERSYLSAKLTDTLTAACTHLSSNVDAYIEYDLNFADYKQQQAFEIRVLNKTFTDKDVVVLGDLNTGPQVTGQANGERNLSGEFAENYALLMQEGFRSPYMNDDGRCNYCSNNPLTGNYPNQALDHIMIRGDSLSTSGGQRLYDTSSPPLSDHYGVGLEVCTP